MNKHSAAPVAGSVGARKVKTMAMTTRTPKFGEPGYDDNGLERPAQEFRFCMTCGEPLPQHYLEQAATPRSRFSPPTGYPICDKPTCWGIDREFSAQVRQRGIIGNTFAIARQWHAYNPVSGAHLIYGENEVFEE